MTDETRLGLPILAFEDAPSFERWMATQPDDAAGMWLKLAKKGSGIIGLTKPDAIDVALCQGWIDGQQHLYDADHWLTRFTPRRPASRWSQVNRARASELIECGRMGERGLAEIGTARADGRWDAAYAPASTAQVPEELAAALLTSPTAATTYAALSGASRYAIHYRLSTVKRPETRARKVETFVAALADGLDPIR